MSYPTYLVHFNKNHNPKNGQFTFGDGDGDGKGNDHGRRDGEGSGDLSGTTSTDSSYGKYSSSLNESFEHEYASGPDGSKGKFFDICVKALTNIGAISKEEASDNYYIEQDLFDFFNGYQSIAYLASKGYSKDQIQDIVVSNHKFEEVNKKNKNRDTYPSSNPYLESVYKKYYNTDKNGDSFKEVDTYIDECVKLAKEMEHSDLSDYLVHFNRNHDKNGRFTYGDGDGDGVVNNKSSNRYNKNVGLHKVTYNPKGITKISSSDNVANAQMTGGKTYRKGFGETLGNKQVGISRRSGRDYAVKAGRRNPPEKSGDQTRNNSGSSNPWDSRRGSNINVVGGSSKGYGSSLSAEQVDEYRVAGQSWVVDKLDEITDPEWWKEQEKKARVQLGLYVKGDKTVSGKSHEVTPKATKVTKSTPKKQEKQKTR